MRRLATLLVLVGGVGLAFTVAGVAEALRTPVVVEYRVTLARWPAGQPPLRIVQLTDVHVSWPDMPPARLARIVAQANALRPDMTVLTGDYDGGKLIDRGGWPLSQKLKPLAGLRAPLGVHIVLGNHDQRYWSNWAFAKVGMRVLGNGVVDTGPVAVAGLHDMLHLGDPVAGAARIAARAPIDKPLLLLAHEPDHFQWLPRQVDLLIAGHTHGGQLGWLGARVLSPFLRAHRRGQFAEGGKQMIVSSGIGTTFVPLRLGVPPEIVVITVGGHSVGRNSGTDR